MARKTKRWITALAAVVLCGGAGELFCRLVLPPPGFEPQAPSYPPGLYEDHAVRGYSYAPNFEAAVEAADFTYRVRTNSLGLRGPEISRDFDGTTILAIGDSLTAGWGLELEQAWPARLEARLGERARGDDPVRVLTAAVPGYNTRQIRLLAEEFVPLFRPRMIIAGIYPYGYSRMFDPYVLVEGRCFRSLLSARCSLSRGVFSLRDFYWRTAGCGNISGSAAICCARPMARLIARGPPSAG